MKPWLETLQDQIVDRSSNKLIDLPSRIVFQASRNFYCSKVDGKAYIYCFAPVCNHTNYTCLADPGSSLDDFHLSKRRLSMTAFIAWHNTEKFILLTEVAKNWNTMQAIMQICL